MADDTNTAERAGAYDMIDRFLRNNLSSDEDYAEYSKALDLVLGASLAASAGSEPVASDGWLHQDGLLYRLTDERRPCNRDEINVTMADGSRSIESRSRRALELLDRIRATHSSPPEGMAGWISVDKRLPDETQAYGCETDDCLVLLPNGRKTCAMLVRTTSGAKWLDQDSRVVYPSHWRELPQDPPLPASEAKEL